MPAKQRWSWRSDVLSRFQKYQLFLQQLYGLLYLLKYINNLFFIRVDFKERM